MSLKGIAKATLAILEAGTYLGPEGQRDIASQIHSAVSATRLYTPDEIGNVLANMSAGEGARPATEVTSERTQEAAHRLVSKEAVTDLVLLNFASARNPGGGFVKGARAQEEDVTRCSALYPCLQAAPGYYRANRAEESLLYTDHIIHSPRVPFFRRVNRDLLAEPYLASVITAPALNAGQALRRDSDALPSIEVTLRRRAGNVLAVARDNGHRTLLLGAWGCGVFMNQPAMVADAFGTWLDEPRFQGAFDRVVFAVYDRSKSGATLKAFEARFGAAGTA